MADLTIYEKPMNVADVRRQVNFVQAVMSEVMKDGEHYGIIPGCKKPSLYKAGAEKLSMVFRLEPRYDISITNLPNGHREVTVTCTLYSIGTEVRLGSGVGSASTMEAKYRYRDMQRVCPECGKDTIIKGKKEYGGGWLCYKNKGGCGTKFKDDDPAIMEQIVGKIEYDNPADFYNTVLKMAKKRAHIDATLTVTGTSDIFAQDIKPEPEDEPTNGNVHHEDPAAEAAMKESAVNLFDRLWAEKHPSAAQAANLLKFLACYKGQTADEVKAQASAQFEAFWKIFIEWCAQHGGKTSKKSQDAATADLKPEAQGSGNGPTTATTSSQGPVDGVTQDQIDALDKIPLDIVKEGYAVLGIDPTLAFTEFDAKTATDLLTWAAKK